MSNPDQNRWQAAAEAARAADDPNPAPPQPAHRPVEGVRRPGGPATGRNPLLPPPPAMSDVGEVDDDLAAPVMVSGPATPTGAPRPGSTVLQVPTHITPGRSYAGLLVQVCGLHGGAGTSTVSALLGPEAADCGPGLHGMIDPYAPVVLVARTHARGLRLVRQVAGQWASGGLHPVRLLGLVLVDDAPALSKGLQREVKSVEAALPHSWRLSWSEDLRHDPELPEEAARGRLRRIRKSLLDEARKIPRQQARGNHSLKKGSA